MIVNQKLYCLLEYKPAQILVEKYYRRKTKKTCFLIKQNNRWTIVRVNY